MEFITTMSFLFVTTSDPDNLLETVSFMKCVLGVKQS
jgi:hypothetical protein